MTTSIAELPPPPNAVEVAERVGWEDVDLVGIMRYSAYTRMLDVAEMELWRAAGLGHPAILERHRTWLPRRVLHLEYHAPAKFDALLRVRVWLGRVGARSLTLHFDVRDEQREVRHAAGHLVLVAVDDESFRSRDVPAEVVERLRAVFDEGAAPTA